MDFESNIECIISHFPFNGKMTGLCAEDSGLINSTYKIEFTDEKCESKYILQKINTNVFKNPDELMSNIMNVTTYLRNQISLEGGNPQRDTLTFLYTNENTPYFRDENGNCWRVYRYIDKCYTVDKIDNPVKAYRSGKAFGHFQKLLADYPIDNLFETIRNFHNTPSRFDDLNTAIENNLAGRKHLVKDEIEFALSRLSDASKLTDMIKNGEIPVRVTHNDTKINNVLFDSITHEAFCVIDLDTIMPGLSLYDFGDSIRSSAVAVDETEKDLTLVDIDMELYENFTKGFIEEAGSALTKTELDNLAFSAKLMTLECGVRFLTDYLNGDTYFKTAYPEQNLFRCRNQFRLVEKIESRINEMNKIVSDEYRRAVLEK